MYLSLDNIANGLGLEEVIEYANLFCEYILILEQPLRWWGVGFYAYFTFSLWNSVEFFIALTALGRIVLTYTLGYSYSFAVVSLRVTRLVRRSRGLTTYLRTFRFSLPALLHISLVLLLVFFIYAIVGMTYLGNIQHGNNPNNPNK